ncbi:MAG: amidohydrolase family protein [Betaproteobacteria bacterium]
MSNYRRVYQASEALVSSEVGEAALANYLRMYEALDARAVVIKARDLETTFGFRISNEDVAAFCRQHGPRYIGFAGVDPNKGMQALRDLHHAVHELGLRGLNVQGFEHRLHINDKRMYPLYAKCVELDIPVNIHVGMNFSTHTSMSYGRPENLDEVLQHFPELRVCASPPGWPWLNELIAVAWRHPNLWIGLVAVRPKLLMKPESGYGPLLQYGNTVLKHRVLFGSGFPMMPVRRSVSEIEALPLDETVRERWLHGNAAEFLRLDSELGKDHV